MSVYRPKDKDGNEKSPYFHFDFTVTINGERRRFHGSTGEKSSRAAKAFEEKEKRRVKSGGPNDHMTLAAAIERYTAEILSQKTSGIDTVTGFQHCERLIGGDRRLANIVADDISMAVLRRSGETVGKRAAKAVSNATVNRNIIEPMRALMFHASRAWGVNCQPHMIMWRGLKRKEAGPRDREMTRQEEQRFWEALRPDFILFTVFQFSRGLRLRSGLDLQKLDVDLENRRIRVWIKGRGERWQRISNDDAALIEREMAKSPLPCVWTYEVQRGPKKGMRLPLTASGYRRSFETALKAAAIRDFRRHDMRHDFASKLLRATKDIALVQKALGHSDIGSTMRYAHILDDDVSAGLNTLSRNSTGEAVRRASK